MEEFEANKRVLQPVWDQLKEALAQAGIRPWDWFEDNGIIDPDFFCIGEAYWNLPEHEGHRAWVQIVYLKETKGPVFRYFETNWDNEKRKIRSYSLKGAKDDIGPVIEYLKRLKGMVEEEKAGEKRKSPADDENKEEPADFLAQVRAVCAMKKAKADQEAMTISGWADTTVKLLKKYGIYGQVNDVLASAESYTTQTQWVFTPLKNIRLWVRHAGDETAEVTIGPDFTHLLRGTIQECVRVVAALLKAPGPQ